MVKRFSSNIDVLFENRKGAPPKEIPPFAADRYELDFLALMLSYELLSRLDQVGIESAAQAPVRGHQRHYIILVASRVQQGIVIVARPRSQTLKNSGHGRCVGARGEHSVLSPLQLGGRNHLHGPRELLHALYRPDPPSDVL